MKRAVATELQDYVRLSVIISDYQLRFIVIIVPVATVALTVSVA